MNRIWPNSTAEGWGWIFAKANSQSEPSDHYFFGYGVKGNILSFVHHSSLFIQNLYVMFMRSTLHIYDIITDRPVTLQQITIISDLVILEGAQNKTCKPHDTTDDDILSTATMVAMTMQTMVSLCWLWQCLVTMNSSTQCLCWQHFSLWWGF